MPQRQNETEEPKGGVLGGVRQVPYPIEPDAEGHENKELAESIPLKARTRTLHHPNEGTEPDTRAEIAVGQPLYAGNEDAATGAVIGADRTDTVTPANPTPPTNQTSPGETPPNMVALDTATKPLLDPTLFAAQRGGMPHEASGTELKTTVDNPYTPAVDTMTESVSAGDPRTLTPNADHPSNPDKVDPARSLQDPHPARQPATPGMSGEETRPDQDLPEMAIESLVPDSVTAVDAEGDMVGLTVHGQGFTEDCVIVFDDEDLPTIFVDPSKIRSDQVPGSTSPRQVDVEVARGEETTDVVVFEFTAADAPEATQEKREQKRKPKRNEPRKGKGKDRK